MNKVEAIQKSIKIWTWLYENPQGINGLSTKNDAYNNLFHGEIVDYIECPLCEYASEKSEVYSTSDMCIECPALGYWGRHEAYGFNPPCQVGMTPWNDWRVNSSADGKRQAAIKMVEMLNRVLADQPTT